ncbi:MAG TPA: agmatinase [Candidatus Thalassarchaeaceae archaeon]|nr:agmatinase [Candidatus Thalassarchaeaceae archaeon]|tara:strand:- start:3506 stop:4438 length:933 start_codon:yes stop_codon:yes gene_type:complete
MEGLGNLRFLGLEEMEEGPWDVVVLQVPLEMTSSYGEGTVDGPNACVEASSQVELFDPLLPSQLPCGARIHTAKPWQSDAPNLRSQLDSIRDYMSPWIESGAFPLVLGGEHGILLPIIEALRGHWANNDLSDLTIVQIDAHADLRDELNGERFSHGTVIRRVLDLGVGKVIQIGIRAYSEEEMSFINRDSRVEAWFARDLLGIGGNGEIWSRLIDRISNIGGPVWLTFDIDGLDGALVPSTGTPVPGGISHWEAIELIEELVLASKGEIIGADVNEIVPDSEGTLTEFSAAIIAVKIIACHIASELRQKD